MYGTIKFNIGRITTLFIALCILLYIFPLIDLKDGAFNFSLVFKEPWRILTSMFLHSTLPHLFYNMLSLFIFGNLIEIHCGSKNFLLVSFVSGIFGSFAFGIMNPATYSVGISGVIFGLIGSAVVLFPDTKALMPVGIISIPAKVKFAGPMIAFGELVMGFFPSHIGHHAHFGGFFVGVLLGFYLRKNIYPKEEFPLGEVEL